MTTAKSITPDTVMGRALARRAVHLTATLEAITAPTGGESVLDLTHSQPAVLPEAVRQAAKDALARGETHYTSRPGVVPLRKAIARQVTDDGFPATEETVVVTNGGAEGLYITLQAILSAGDRIVIPEPIDPNIAAMVEFIGAKLIRVPTGAEGRFLPAVDDLLQTNASAVLLSTPSAITGVAPDPDWLRDLATGAAEREMTVILDRSLAAAAYDPARVIFGAPDLGATIITIGSFSIGYGLDGWRVGYFTAPPDRMKSMRNLKQAMSICTTAVSQFAALTALEEASDWLAERRQTFATRRDEVVSLFADADLPIITPDAFPALLVDVRGHTADDRALAERLAREIGARVRPGSDFGVSTAGFVRLDLSAMDDHGLEATRRIVAAIGNWRRQ